MKILGLETSCDETSAAVVKDGKEVLSNIVSSQVDFHRKYGGIVPEIAARKHAEVINAVIAEAMEQAGVGFNDLAAVAVTDRPGLPGALLVGVCAAKAISFAQEIPLIRVNHIIGHIYANFVSVNPNDKIQNPKFPFICLVVSGGHTELMLVKGHGEYQGLGRTRDDAAGEVFDKVARFLKLGYPGGPLIDQMAKSGNARAISFPRSVVDGYDFSFSGLKTAVINYVKKNGTGNINDLAASFQQAVVDVLVDKALKAARDFKVDSIALAGGVSANSLLREQFQSKGEQARLNILIPAPAYCTDNAAMIAAAGYYARV